MGAVVWASSRLFERVLDTGPITGQIVAVGAPVLLGVGAYLGFCLLFKVEELDHVRGLIRRRLPDKAQGLEL
jgi:hypothetical protein